MAVRPVTRVVAINIRNGESSYNRNTPVDCTNTLRLAAHAMDTLSDSQTRKSLKDCVR